MKQPLIKQVIQQSIEVKQNLLQDETLLTEIEKVALAMADTFKNQGKVLFCGNGGSAADAQHIAAELSGRFYLDRAPLFAEALHVNTSYLTAVANDYNFDVIYSRLVQAMGKKGDILIAISTSGNSKNIIQAVEMANSLGMITVGFTGERGGKMKEMCQHLINVPSLITPRIQEAHILIGHLICEITESVLFKK